MAGTVESGSSGFNPNEQQTESSETKPPVTLEFLDGKINSLTEGLMIFSQEIHSLPRRIARMLSSNIDANSTIDPSQFLDSDQQSIEEGTAETEFLKAWDKFSLRHKVRLIDILEQNLYTSIGDKEYLSVQEAAFILKISPQRVGKLIQTGRINATKDEQGFRSISMSDLKAFRPQNPGRPSRK